MFRNLKVRTRLIILAAMSSAALLIVGSIGLYNGHRTSLEIDHVYFGGLDKVEQVGNIEQMITAHFVIPIQKVRDGVIGWNEAAKDVQDVHQNLDRLWNLYAGGDSGLAEDMQAKQRPLVEQGRTQIASLNSVVSRTLEALQHQDKNQLNAIATKELYPAVEPLLSTFASIVQLHTDDTQNDYQSALSNSYWFQTTTLLAIVLSLGILIPMTAVIIRSIVKPIEYVSERISSGDTTADIQISAGGELGSLIESLQRMFASLNKVSDVLTAISTGDLTVEGSLRSDKDALGLALHAMVTQMRVMIGDIKVEVHALTTSSQEIMTSLSHISSGAAETASAVTETTTTVEELKQTANVSVEKAKDVLVNAQETLQAVTSSEESVMATIEDMNQIRERMQIISDSILKLSEKGNAIAEIMDMVNDIAEQSNLLAVNAAIEAAKAGEVGRSFGVVAQEIRTLAEQSKGATVQVMVLLGEIQTATSSAVLATEQGSKAVTKGAAQSTQTSRTIKELSGKMTRVTQAANQIVLSNQQQLIGTEQITVAMTQISEATNQHVEHLKQIETAIATLNQVGGTLRNLTDRYHTAEEAPHSGVKVGREVRREPIKQLVSSVS